MKQLEEEEEDDDDFVELKDFVSRLRSLKEPIPEPILLRDARIS